MRYPQPDYILSEKLNRCIPTILQVVAYERKIGDK